jgi:hypothetical protein
MDIEVALRWVERVVFAGQLVVRCVGKLAR